jgi:hypothetical protein
MDAAQEVAVRSALLDRDRSSASRSAHLAAKNREDLLSAIGPTYWPQVRPRVSPGASFAGIMRATATALIEAMPARARVGAGRLRGLAYSLGNDALMANGAAFAAVASASRGAADAKPA